MKKNNSLKDEIKNELVGIALIALGLFMAFCLWKGPDSNNLNAIGAIGSFIFRTMTTLFGEAKVFLPALIFLAGVTRIWIRIKWSKFTVCSWALLYLSVLAMMHLRLPDELHTFAAGWQGEGGGATGVLFSRLTLALFGKVGSYIFWGACLGVAVIGIFQKPAADLIRSAILWLKNFLHESRKEVAEFVFEKADEKSQAATLAYKQDKNPAAGGQTPLIIDHTEAGTSDFPGAHNSPALVKGHLRLVKDKDKDKDKDTASKKAMENTVEPLAQFEDFKLPPLEILQHQTRINSQRLNKDITDNVKTLEETLENFGVKARVTQVSRGPSITRYEIQPAPGIKVSRIVNLADDIALSLAAPQVRIEAPIPGKAAVGIEVPNEEIATVALREVLETHLFRESPSKLTIALGKDIAGNPIVADLAKMPHLLIAGATGSGKSVCMNAIITSILFKARPDEVKLLMIDPKVVELSNFNGTPHLISPVVTDPKKAATSLRWAVHEMENRYELFAALGVKDIMRYNQVRRPEDTKEQFPLLPYIVVLIDELADLMMIAPADVEDAICRLAQMARAAGIHLVVATQRPSVDVITGVIKANIPSRIAFAVSSQTDSRTILDMGGAERLLGRGDMLFYPTGMAKPLRVQGVFVSDQDVEKLVNFLKAQKNPQYITPWQDGEKDAADAGEDDELIPDAARLFIESGQASISLLQRRFRIGYTRAARIIDQLELKGIVGGYEGSKPRVIRMTWEEYEKTFGN